ncbi:molybdenum ABC transporter ATP-binding protein [Deltaproteobacteria bacterium Smac51]|nr:molybdenum ABC transporter ATP-binding protein [Deltaproteobacteria bacterium Smac51]
MKTCDNETVIRADSLSLKRGRETLLRDLSWQVLAGQHWAVLGVNGAGKTLLMKILTGYVWPTTGTVDILGHRLGRVDLRVLRRRLGWVAKALEELTPGETTVREVILSGPEASLGLYADPTPQQVRVAEELAEEFGLTRILYRQFGLLSSGEKQRALLARAALMKPSILFLDEPMANLDMGGREQFMALLDKMAAGPSAPTIILTTHNTLEIGPFMTHAMMMKNGGVIACGELSETMRPEPLQKAFDLPLKVEKTPSGRYLAYL